ncbi:hypothetical protein Trydic_g13653 [Trypoxylus dichotomus]
MAVSGRKGGIWTEMQVLIIIYSAVEFSVQTRLDWETNSANNRRIRNHTIKHTLISIKMFSLWSPQRTSHMTRHLHLGAMLANAPE